MNWKTQLLTFALMSIAIGASPLAAPNDALASDFSSSVTEDICKVCWNDGYPYCYKNSSTLQYSCSDSLDGTLVINGGQMYEMGGDSGQADMYEKLVQPGTCDGDFCCPADQSAACMFSHDSSRGRMSSAFVKATSIGPTPAEAPNRRAARLFLRILGAENLMDPCWGTADMIADCRTKKFVTTVTLITTLAMSGAGSPLAEPITTLASRELGRTAAESALTTWDKNFLISDISMELEDIWEASAFPATCTGASCNFLVEVRKLGFSAKQYIVAQEGQPRSLIVTSVFDNTGQLLGTEARGVYHEGLGPLRAAQSAKVSDSPAVLWTNPKVIWSGAVEDVNEMIELGKQYMLPWWH